MQTQVTVLFKTCKLEYKRSKERKTSVGEAFHFPFPQIFVTTIPQMSFTIAAVGQAQ